MSSQRTMSLAKLLRTYTPVEQLQTAGHTWETEIAWVRAQHPRRLTRLRRSIERLGIEEPIRLCYGHPHCGIERHVVDGHHRVIIAVELGIGRVPVADAWDGSDWMLWANDQEGDDQLDAV